MKKMIFLAVMFVGFFGGTAMASGDDEISKEARKTFQKQFPHAQFATWDKLENADLYEVRFVQNKESAIAYIDETGNLAAVARNASTEEMPAAVQRSLKRKYGSAEIRSVDELTMDDESSYLFMIKDEKTMRYVRIYSSGIVDELKREKLK